MEEIAVHKWTARPNAPNERRGFLGIRRYPLRPTGGPVLGIQAQHREEARTEYRYGSDIENRRQPQHKRLPHPLGRRWYCSPLLNPLARGWCPWPYSIPKLFHFLSIMALMFRLMVISSGQGREKPSVDHLRVASMPILEP